MDERDVPAEWWLRRPDAAAAFAPSEGFWCTAFRVQVAGQWVRALAEPPSWEVLRTRPTLVGNPLLFPYPMAVSDGTFTHRGERYSLGKGREGRVIHGLVRDHPWTVERTWSDAEGDHIQASINTAGFEERVRQFPLPFRFAATYTLQGRTLALRVEAVNTGERTMPLGFGIHPYVPLPLLPDGRLEDCVTRADVMSLVEVGPRGSSLAYLPVQPPYSLAQGRRVPDLLDAQREQRKGAGGFLATYARRPYTAAMPNAETNHAGQRMAGTAARPAAAGASADTGIHWSLADTRHGIAVELETSPDFQCLVLFAPRHPTTVLSPVLCTCLPDAFNLADHGHPSGVVDLAPGTSWNTWARLNVRVL
jgi:galactose mutarotase-like enzyme